MSQPCVIGARKAFAKNLLTLSARKTRCPVLDRLCNQAQRLPLFTGKGKGAGGAAWAKARLHPCRARRFKGNPLWSILTLKCSNAAHGAACREAAWILPKTAFFGRTKL